MSASIAHYQAQDWSWLMFTLTLSGAVLAHAAVNLLNEYQDNQSGLDFMTPKTPFSGGSGSLQANPLAEASVLNAFKVVMSLLILIGVLVVYKVGWQIVPLGLTGLAMIVFYTKNITKKPWLCLVSPGLAFGPIMVLASYFVLTGSFSWLTFALSMVPFFLVNNLLLLNQVPDLTADRMVGRYNLLMEIGVKNAMYVFALFELLAFMTLIASIFYFDLPAVIALASLTFILVLPMVWIAFKYYEQIDKLMPALAMNVIINIVTPALIGFTLWLAY
ncbi:prenyltransferase [Thiomicrorhabdus sp. Kp2]|uniref:prenyltransferase n=1 Tax=Thiomicrorhabdus sp. Kp2 TaxID=1123518 RepID=UPI0012FEE74F|nr:prenyltransferase [Thiomicrorhabdus sp. Kp2]